MTIVRTILWRYESGESIPRVNTLIQIANALDVRLQDLFVSNHNLTKVRFRMEEQEV